MNDTHDLETFYGLLIELKERLGGFRYLRDCNGKSGWPQRGVYFFFDEHERRSGNGLRVVRVGTHALRSRSQTTLWRRLSQHKGQETGQRPAGGNHRGSVFRFHVGAAVLTRDDDPNALLPIWVGPRPTAESYGLEYELERQVSRYIRDLPFLWLGVSDEAGPRSDRRLIEVNSIALLSTEGYEVDPPSRDWLGHHAPSRAIARSGLWNVNHVGQDYEPVLLNTVETYISQV